MLLKIDRLALRNFRSHISTDLTFPSRTLIIGHNNAGKSSIADAIEWALLGTTTGLDAAGRGLDALATTKDKPLAVEIELAGIGTVKRSANFTTRKQELMLFKVDEHGEEIILAAGGMREVQAAILERLGTTPEILTAVLRFGAFLDLDHAAGKALLLRLLDVKVEIDGEALTLDQVEKREATAVENRKIAKRRLAEFGTPIEPTAPDLLPLDVLRANLAAAKMGGTEAFAAANQRVGERRRVDAESARVRTELARVDARLGDADLDELRAEVGRLEVARAAVDIPEPLAVALAAAADVAERRGELKQLGDVLAALRAHGGARVCVLDAAIPCKTPAKAFSEQIVTIQTKADALAERVKVDDEAAAAAIAARIERERERQAKADEAKALDGKVAAARSRLALVESDTTYRETLREQLFALARTAEDLLAAEGDETETVASNSSEVAVLDGQIAQWERYERAREDYQKTADQVARQAEKVADLDRLCELLGPKGARVQALRSAVEAFEARANHHLQRFGRSIAIELEPWRVMVSVDQTPARPASVLSVSERMRTGVALQLAVAAFSGLGFAFIDEAELLDSENNQALAKMVLEVAGGQIFVAATRDRAWPAPRVPGLQVLRFELVHNATRVAERVEAEPVGV